MKYFVSTPIYYVNDSPHIGHVYTTLAADVIARFKRLDGMKVHFATGTDEHGQKVEKTAIQKGYAPAEYCDMVFKRFRDVADIMGFSYDDFFRTSEDHHKKVVEEVWKKMVDSGDIYLDKYSGWYSVRDEAFFDESEIKDGKAPTGAEVEWIEEPSYFFRLSKWQDKLLELYEQNPDFILPHYRANEVISFVKSGLRDLSVSRTTFDWGIKVPGDEKHVIYVWLDALFYYYTSVNSEERKDFWPPDLQIVGKDILRFHAVYWPAFLMALGLPLPKRIFAHGWWLVEGEKMSKSIGNVIDPFALKEEFSLDYLRYYLVREMPFGNDHSYSRELFITRINTELCNNIGNLCQRVLTFVEKNAGAIVPPRKSLNSEDQTLLTACYEVLPTMRAHMDKQALHSVFGEVIKIGRLANEYIDIQAPWALKKTDPARMEAVLYTLLEAIRIIGILLQPLIPDSAGKVLDTLGIAKDERSFTHADAEHAIRSGEMINKPEVLFPRIGS
jgi:methionyl-tRNA synthetase